MTPGYRLNILAAPELERIAAARELADDHDSRGPWGPHQPDQPTTRRLLTAPAQQQQDNP